MSVDFLTFLCKAKRPTPPERLLALDPGETTGYAYFHRGQLVESGQLSTQYVKTSIKPLSDFFDAHSTSLVVFEDYRIYSWKTDTHTWASLHTPQLLGVIETLCYLRQIKTFRQMAQQPKQFCTDEKLELWHMYKIGERHARDAIRHGCYYQLFNHGKI